MTEEPTKVEIALKVRELLGRATLLRARGDRMQAFQLTQEAIRLSDRSWEAHELLGDLLMEMNRPQEAMASFRRAREINPSRVPLEDKVARAALRRGAARADPTTAEALLAAAGKREPNRRRAGYAAVLSVLMPGLGQVYNGEALKGLILVIAALGLLSQVFGQLDVRVGLGSLTGGQGIVWAILLAVVWIYAIADATIRASREPPDAGLR